MLSGLPEHQEVVVVFPPAACSWGQMFLGCAQLVTIPILALLFWLGAAGWCHVGEGTALSLTIPPGPQLACHLLSRYSLVETLCHILF